MTVQQKSPIQRIPVPADLERRLTEAARQLRRKETPAERALRRALREGGVAGAEFRRQQPIGPFIVDFFEAEHRLIVEVDGAVHGSQVEADWERQNLLEAAGYRVIRFKNEDIRERLPDVLEAIAHTMSQPRSPSLLEGEGARG